MPLNPFVREFLTFLEQQEIRLLSWGFYDVSFDQFEVEKLLLEDGHPNLLAGWRTVKDEGWTINSLLEEMEHNGLLYRLAHGEDQYRTRFAEGVRLIAHLRQRFKLKDWATAPPLVSDIKLHLAPRRYPRRDQSAFECWQDIEEVSWQPDLQRKAFDALSVNNNGELIQFANFQRKAFKAILTSYKGKGFTGSVISAGTGSGKTKGFYIPALLGAITELPPRQQPFTKIIAIYPRNVLLADQLRETISEAAKIQPVLERFGLRSLTFGALLGMTPEEKKFTRDENGKYPAEKIGWKRIGSGFIVPFLKSPQDPNQDLIWRDHERLTGSTALYRVGGDSHEPDLLNGTLVLTREQLQTNPPDVLFLSAEMLNREMGNPAWAKTFGIQQGRFSPRLLLLDEVHSYEGVNGAQIAWVFRRWRYWSGINKLHFVGLSATLKEAQKHLGQVAGIPAAAIQEFAPLDSELDMRDVEYNLAVKGDPSSGASLLATSIQTGMLLARLLTPRHVPNTFIADHQVPGPSLYGRKVFGFTDNLDGINRWYSDMSDAESNLRLAHLRLHPEERQPQSILPQSTLRAMDRDGQIWELPRTLGHNLAQPLRVSRCTSQDPGANTGSDIIIASASLEVGFDDPEVGAILHHKKPISVSSFIQRKGRAGRRLGTRPWTVVVLSDYGADRWAFQNAERLFEPAIESIFLPISNPYVLRIQATYFLVDWLGRRLGNGSPFRYLAYYNGEVAHRVIKILKDFLVLGPEWKDFRRDFHRVFGRPQGIGAKVLSEIELDAILWRTPRPVLRHVVPALLRRLQAHWRYANPKLNEGFEDRATNRPLPQYLPAATFSELGGIDARLRFPATEQRDDEYLSVSRALFETCPGRVSKRYALRIREEGYWLKFSSQLLRRPGLSTASTQELFRDRILIKEVDGVLVYRPLTLELDHRPPDVLDSSNASWNWQSQIHPFSHGAALPIFYASPWRSIVDQCRAYLHRDYSGIEVLRFSRSSIFELRLKRGRLTRGLLTLQSVTKETQQQDEAVGFDVEADGIVVTLRNDILENYFDSDEGRTARFRPDYYLSQMRSCPLLSQSMNSFLLEWMWQTSLAMLTATSVEKRCPLSEAQRNLKGHRRDAANRVMDSIFQIRDVSTSGEESEARVRKRIIDQWSDSAVVTRLEELERSLWEPLGESYQSWVKQRYVATLAQAFRAAVVSRQSDISEDDLMVDVVCNEENVNIYLTETGSGGLGQIEAVVKELRQSPERFIDGLKFSIASCRRNFLTSNLIEVVDAVVSSVDNSNLRAAFAIARAAKGFEQMAHAKQSLQQALEQAGFDSSRDIVVAIVTKLLRAGSSPRSDATTHLLNQAWRRAEIKLGIAIDPRTFAYVCIHYAPARRRLVRLFWELSGGEDPTDSQLYSVVQQLLLPGCEDSCPECLDHPNQFNDFGRPSRSLVLDSLRLAVTEVYVREQPEDWLDQARTVLLREFRVRLVVEPSELAQVGSALQGFLAEELDACNLLLPVSISAIERTGVSWSITLQIRGVSNE
jgi:hypothetical protein